MTKKDAVVAVYNGQPEAEAALRQLYRARFDLKRVSIIAKDRHPEEQAVGSYQNGFRLKYWGKSQVFWDWLWGMLSGAGFFALPDVGPVLVAGPFVSWMLGALEASVIVDGLSAIGVGLHLIGIPRDSILRYESALKADKVLLLAHGAAAEVGYAADLLSASHPADIGVYVREKLALVGVA